MRNIIIIFIIGFLSACSINDQKYIGVQTKEVFDTLYQKNEFKINRTQLKYFFQNQDLFKKQMLKYINMDWDHKNYLPNDDFFYLVGITQDSIYFDDLFMLVIKKPEINYTCTYSCGIVFSLIMTATDNKIKKVKNNINDDVIFSDVFSAYSFYKKPRNAKKILSNQTTLKFADEENNDLRKKIQKLPIDDILLIAGDNKRSYIERFIAINTVQYKYSLDKKYQKSEKLITEILYILYNAPNDESDEFKSSCQNSLLNILKL